MPKTRRGHRPRLQRRARGESAKDSQQPNVVFVAEQRGDLNQSRAACLAKGSRNFFFLSCSEEPVALGEFAELDSHGEMPIDSASHEPARPRDFID